MREDLLLPNINQSLPMYVDLTGISYCDGNYHINRIDSKLTVIEYVLDGEGYIEIYDKIFKAQKDDIYIIPKGTNHHYYSDSKNPWKKVFINFKGDLPNKLLKEYGIEDQVVFEGKNIKFLFEKIIKIVNNKENSPEIHAKLGAIYAEILARLAINKTTPLVVDEMDTLKHYLDNNTNRIIKNKELAELIFRSQDYIIKNFSKKFGITPYEYQIREKISIAKRLLKDTVLPIYEIASTIGYDDAQYFSNLFKKRCNMTPGAYRKNN